MKKLKLIVYPLLILIILAVIAGGLFVVHINKRAIPDYNKSVSMNGLRDKVTVYRDSLGIPHVYAKNEHDLYAATGYLLAEDRLWQMDLLRRLTVGRLSEIFGKEYVDIDLLFRSLRFSEKSKMILDSSRTEVLASLKAFSDGVNQYIDSHQNNLPFEFAVLGYKPRHWEPVHSLNLIGYMAWDLKAGWSQMILDQVKQNLSGDLYQQLLPHPSEQPVSIYGNFQPDTTALNLRLALFEKTNILNELGVTIFNGSNNWVVSGKKSVTGKPLLANDMHLGLQIPGIWYQMHQVIDGKLNVTGLLLPGQPLIIAGHNDSIAWGMTNVYVDNMDFYEEKINPENHLQYEVDGKWRNMMVKDEVIHIKGGDSVSRELKFTYRGPVISGFKNIKDKTISMHWVGDEYSNEFRTVYLLNRAHNWSQFKDAVRTFLAVSQNINYADVKGNIGLYCCAGVPVRKRTTGFSILPGWTSENDWQGFVPFNQLPHSYNPDSGFLVSANNKTADNEYPYYIGQWYALPDRFNRITEMLKAKEKLSAEDFQQIQTDQHSKLVERMKPALDSMLTLYNGKDSLIIAGITIMKNWDGNMDKELAAPAIFENFYQEFIDHVFRDEMGSDLFENYKNNTSLPKFAVNNIWKAGKSKWCDDVNTPDKKENLTDMTLLSFESAMDTLAEQLGSDPVAWRWGAIHRLTLKHPLGKSDLLNKVFSLNRGPFGVGGSFHTVCPYSYPFGEAFEADHGASHRHIFDLSDWDKSFTVIPTGESGVPSSDFYCNQTNLYINKKYHHDYFSRDQILKHAAFKMEFTGK